MAEKETTLKKSTIESELSEINSILESAKDAVGHIKSAHLNEIRSLKMTPEPIQDILSAELILLEIQDNS